MTNKTRHKLEKLDLMDTDQIKRIKLDPLYAAEQFNRFILTRNFQEAYKYLAWHFHNPSRHFIQPLTNLITMDQDSWSIEDAIDGLESALIPPLTYYEKIMAFQGLKHSLQKLDPSDEGHNINKKSLSNLKYLALELELQQPVKEFLAKVSSSLQEIFSQDEDFIFELKNTMLEIQQKV